MNVRRRFDLERETQAALLTVAAGLQAHLHDTLAHRGLVAERRRVPDGINHRVPSGAKARIFGLPLMARLKPMPFPKPTLVNQL